MEIDCQKSEKLYNIKIEISEENEEANSVQLDINQNHPIEIQFIKIYKLA